MVILDDLMITMMLGDAAGDDDDYDNDDDVDDDDDDDVNDDDDDVNDDDAVWRLLSQEEGQEFTNCLRYKPTPPGNIASRYLEYLVIFLSCYIFIL